MNRFSITQKDVLHTA